MMQPLKEKELLEGDTLTTYFMAKVHGRKCKKYIVSFKNEYKLIQGNI
jgi:hypothetical protein